MSRPIHTWVAMCFLAIRVSALPQAATAPTAPLPPGPIVNVTQQTPITGNVSIMTSLIIGDKSGCDPDQKIAINQAYLDALNLVGTVGGYNGPGYLYASTSVPPWDYFGAFLRHTDAEKSQIMRNFISAQAPNKQWGIGDWWYNRHFDIFCNDPGDKEGHSCSAQGSASGYEVEPSYRNDGGVYPLINFCDSFWNMETLAQRVAQVEAGGFGFDKNDVRSLVCQGSAFLHEMFHTSATESGVSSPRCQDVKVSGYPGKAYGPARAKQLARMDLGGPGVTSINVDNYVFYSISWYMYAKWAIIPRLPNYGWPRLSAEEAYPDDSAPDDDDDSNSTATIDSGAILDDADFYAGSGYTPSGGYQPAGPTGPSSVTETIPMATAAVLQSGTSTPAPPTSSTAPSPPAVAYAAGVCSFHVDEYQDCADDSKNLFATITMYDNAKTVIGTTSVPEGSLGVSISTAYSFISKLASPMVVTGEHENDYIQFTIGALSFTSRTKTGDATCNPGGWDPKDGPECDLRAGNVNAENQIDCSFPC